MTQEQFKQFWVQLQAPLKAKWGKITDADLGEIKGISPRSPKFFRNVTVKATRMKSAFGLTVDMPTGAEII